MSQCACVNSALTKTSRTGPQRRAPSSHAWPWGKRAAAQAVLRAARGRRTCAAKVEKSQCGNDTASQVIYSWIIQITLKSERQKCSLTNHGMVNPRREEGVNSSRVD